MQYFVVGVYIPPSNLGTTLTHMALNLYYWGISLPTINPRDEQEDRIAKQVDARDLVDVLSGMG